MPGENTFMLWILLKLGIGLRGYNQKDPLVEYKKESYNMFIDLVSNIKLEIIKILFTIQLPKVTRGTRSN